MELFGLDKKKDEDDIMEFFNKIFIISGTSSGIGKACAKDLLSNSSYVIGLDIQDTTIKHDKYTHFLVDIRDEEKIKNIVDEITLKFGKVNGLVNCIGIFANGKPFYEISLDEWNNVISTNLTGMFILSKYVSQNMIRNNSGNIVNISCIRSKIFGTNMADYAASKAGVVALTSTMALDLKKYNIRVNSIAPGFTYTGMTKDSFDNQEIREYSERIIPVGKIAEPKDIANVVLFLLSKKADYITGETIYVDGGFKIFK